EGAVRRLLDPRRGLEGGGRRVGQAGAPVGPRHEGRDPPGRQHRRVPAGQRVGPEGAGVARGDGTALTDPRSGRQAVEAVWRIESARIVGTLARTTGDFALAEDLAQEALAEALVAWPRDGVPRNPAGWLLTVGRRRAIDTFRRRSALDERYAVLARDFDEEEPGADTLFDPDAIHDDVL